MNRFVLITSPLVIAMATAMFPLPVAAQAGLPPLPANLEHASAVACIWINDPGTVTKAFIVTSTGSTANDRDLISWVKQLHWHPVKAGDTSRNRWIPMPVAFGETSSPAMPATCSPPADL